MDWCSVSSLLILLNIFGITQAFFETCDQTISIGASETKYVQSNGYPNVGHVPGSSCRYTIVAPTEYQVRASCTLYMNDPSNGGCSSERFYFATNGNKDLSTSTYYCGNNVIATLTSNGNQMVLAYISKSYSGLFSCTLTTTCDCGWSVSSRIVGGTEASPNEFTPMAAVVAKTNAKFFCGGTIVSSRYIVSAAHCLHVTTVDNTVIATGEHDTLTGSDSNYTAIYLVEMFIDHPFYSATTNLNDIGLIKTKTSMLWSKAVSPVCLPFYYTNADFVGQVVTATGWGSMEFGRKSSNVLQKVNLDVKNNSDSKCTSYYPSIAATQLCTFTPNKDTCQFDSGGPLFFRVPTDPRLFLVALVSLGDGCASKAPALNFRITSYLGWIESITGTLCRRALG